MQPMKNVVVYSLPNDNISTCPNLKHFADDNSNVVKMTKFVIDRVEKIVKKGENAGYPPFLLFLQYFQEHSFSGLFKIGIAW